MPPRNTPPPPMLFMSYRRDDSGGHVGRLYDALGAKYGNQRLFFDIDHIGAGQDFVEVIDDAVTRCAVMLVAIGKRWTGPDVKQGTRRIDDPGDFVRMEVAAGLKRKGLPVIPVLVAGGQMLGPAELPDDLKDLARRNAFELSDLRWKDDVARLIAQLDAYMKPGHAFALPPAVVGKPWIKWGGAAAAAVLVIGLLVAAVRGAHWAPVMQTSPAMVPSALALPSGAAAAIPSRISQVAHGVLANARQQWLGDAVLVGVNVQLARDSAARDLYTVSFDCRSKTTEKRLIVVTNGPKGPQQTQSTASAAPTKVLPDDFVDLPDAIKTARDSGMFGQVRTAVLVPDGTTLGHAIWSLKPVVNNQRTYTIDAVTGELVRHPTRIPSGPIQAASDNSESAPSSGHHGGIGGLFSKVGGVFKKN